MKPELPANGLVIECAEKGEPVWGVHFQDPPYPEEVRTYHTKKIADGVAGRYRRTEGREVLGVYEYSAEEVQATVAAWRARDRARRGY